MGRERESERGGGGGGGGGNTQSLRSALPSSLLLSLVRLLINPVELNLRRCAASRAGITVHTNPCERLSVRVSCGACCPAPVFAPTPCASLTVCDHPTPCASGTVCDVEPSTRTTSTSTSCRPPSSRSGAAYSLTSATGGTTWSTPWRATATSPASPLRRCYWASPTATGRRPGPARRRSGRRPQAGARAPLPRPSRQGLVFPDARSA